jgi:serine/threonine protein kinase
VTATPKPPSDSIGRRYRILDMLGQGGMGTVHLAKDRLDGLVALKRLGSRADREAETRSVGQAPRRVASAGAVSPEAPTQASGPEPSLASTLLNDPAVIADTVPSSRTARARPRAPADSAILARTADLAVEDVAEILRLTLAREFHLLASLRHPNIISVLDYGFDDDLSPYFTMELLQGAETIMKAATGRSLEDKLDLLAQTLHALAYLHRRGVIHRDLKPGNVMVVSGRVKVLDFGVATPRAHRIEGGPFIIGTLAYMAPELLAGAPAGEASDLYAVGTIAYELFTGRHPFDLGDVLHLRDDILRKAPDLSLLDPRLAPVVGRLLDKRPEARPDGVDEVFADLAACTSRPLQVETAATRESFLQAAELVGRDEELARLSAMLDEAMVGRGGGALVGGESGVGKTRLLDELRTRALVDGVVVIRGQAADVGSAGGGPYHVFREVLRGLVLRTDLDDFEAGVLEPVVPDLSALIERAVHPPAEIDHEAAHDRLCSVVEALFRRQKAPVLVILEDLQWAGSESLRLLSRLASASAALPVLFVGSFRDDERADLPRELPHLRLLTLGRLSGEGIAALAVSMLGEAGRRPEVVDRLRRETEGNPFFLVEVVRVLAEDAGALSRVGIEPMPATLPAGGLHLIVRRRLNRVPLRARPLLEAAAVVGRKIDQALLHRLEPDADLEAWIRTCANVAVLDFDEGSFRFAHDKLREGLLSALTPEASRALHRRVAEAIEAEYGDEPEQTMALAHHWALAGDLENEARYSAAAGEQALQSSAYAAAAAFFERAIAIASTSTESATSRERAGLLGRALSAVEPVLPIAPERISSGSARFRLGLWEGRLSEAYGRMSRHADAVRHGVLALAHLGRPMPSGPVGLAAGLPVQAALRGVMSLAPQRFTEPSGDARAVLQEALRVHARITEACFYTQESLPLLWSGLSILNLGEPAGPSADLARGYALMAAVAGIVPLHPMAEAWSRRALELVEGVGKPYDVAFVIQRVCSYRLWMADWEVAEAGFRRELAIAKDVHDRRLVCDALSCCAFGAFFRGRHGDLLRWIGEIDALLAQVPDQALALGAPVLRASAVLREGDPHEAMALCRSVQAAIVATNQSHEVIRCHGVLALASQRAGDLEGARAAIDRTLGALNGTRPVAYWTFDGMTAVAEAALSTWESSGAPADRERAETACKAARVFGSIFPIGRPFAALWEGLLAQLSGRPQKAQREWNRAIDEAERLRMPYEHGRALFEIGRHLERGHPERLRLLGRAEVLFAGAGAEHDRGRALAEIRGG